MANVNKVILIGNITRDIEVKFTPKGTANVTLGLAINRKYTLEGGEKREEVTFVDVELWGRHAEIAGEYCKKGKPVYIEGRLKLDTWDDKGSGAKRSKRFPNQSRLSGSWELGFLSPYTAGLPRYTIPRTTR